MPFDVNLIPAAPHESKTKPIERDTPIQAVRSILTNSDTYATTLLVWAIECYGTECLKWSPSTIKLELEQQFGCRLPKDNFDKLVAAVIIVTSDMFFKNVSRFIPLANVLAGDDFDPDEFEKADVVECAWAVTESLLLNPPDEDDPEPFSDEVRHYIGQVLHDEGFVAPPDILKIALDADHSDWIKEFADDQELMAEINANQQSKAEEVNTILKDGLAELIQQLQSLPLRHGNVTELAKRLQQNLR